MAAESEPQRLAALAEAVRESSLKRFRCVAPGDESWRPAPGTLSFVDVLKHLGDADDWLLTVLGGGRSRRAVISPDDASAEQWDNLLTRFIDLGRRKTALIRSLTPEQLATPILEPEVCGQTTWWWLIARANLDHEIHHRGAVQLGLRLRYGRVEPLR